MGITLALLSLLTPLSSTATLFAAQDDGGAGALGGLCCMAFWFVFLLVIPALFLICFWKIFDKAGRPGWEGIIPIYNHWLLVTEICKLEPMWFFLAFVPIGNIIAAWVVSQETAKKFGKTEGFGYGLFFLPFVFYPILAFGSARYVSKKKKKYYDDEDEEDEEDEEEEERPRSKTRRDEEEDERPQKRRRDEEEEERPPPKRRRDEEEDERPRNRRRDDDDDDDRPQPKKRRRDDDD